MSDRFEDERKLAALTFEKRDLKKREKEINGEIRDLEERILERWEAEAVTGVPLTNATLSMRKDGYVQIVAEGDDPTPEEKAAICEALIAAGYPEYVTTGFNSRSVSSLAKEERWDKNLPPELEGKLKYDPPWKIVVRAKKPKEDDAAEDLAESPK